MTDYGKLVKKRLIDIEKPQSWLIEQVRQKENCFIDSAYMSRILNGQRKAERIRGAINEILNIKEE